MNCNHDAIHVENMKALIDYDKCVGCGQCIALCKREAAIPGSTESSEILNYKIAEYTKAVLKDKPHFHVAFIMNVSPERDRWGLNDAAIVPDLGMAASTDPVALDQACADLVNAAPTLHTENMLLDKEDHAHHTCECHHTHQTEGDKFHILHPNTNWQAGLRYAEEIGIGTREYELK